MIVDAPFHAKASEERFRQRTQGSWQRYQRAVKSLAGGVSTALRRSARPYPMYFSHGSGSRLVDVDNNEYVDYGLAWGPLILGHSHPSIQAAVNAVMRQGATFGHQHDLEYQVAEMIQKIVPCAELVCYANSGTEIVQVALRLARGITGRSRFLKFEGHYHGWDDSVLVSYRAGAAQLADRTPDPIPTGQGQRASSDAAVARWNHPESVTAAFDKYGDQIGAIICEPMLCNSGCIPPDPGFLEFLRETANRHGALLIFDEVITGFRLALGGGQQYYGVTPDLATFAKAIGGGLAISALAGKREYMEWIADGRVVHAGTLNGNLVALAGAHATIEELSQEGVYPALWRRGETLRQGVTALLREAGLPVQSSGGGPVFQISFQDSPAREYRDTIAADKTLYSDFAMALLEEGILLLPDGRWYISTAHTDADISQTLEAVRKVTR